ncbi:MAG: DegT/DnrJ/EryC1/StrS family aminotransferase [Gemmatimonadaceae bacterium]
MTLRRQLAVASPISPASLLRALFASARGGTGATAAATEFVRSTYGSASVALTDSGTSALIMALRLAVPDGGIVAFPGYACVDLAAAARFAKVRVRLYDLDPATLSPDLVSVSRVLARGVDAIVVAHLFAYPADLAGVHSLAAGAGVPVIEDAAQGSGGTVGGVRLGASGDLSVLSFGRGKGLCAGGGGAILTRSDRWIELVDRLGRAPDTRGVGGVGKTAVQWLLGRPAFYAIPSALPWLHLGEMVYHAAHEPAGISVASSALVATAFSLEARELQHRRQAALALDAAAARADDVAPIVPIAGASPGYLRYAVRDLGGRRSTSASLGVVQPYPRALREQPELAPVLIDDEPATPGSVELRRTLFTLPTHRFVDRRDVSRLATWLRGGFQGPTEPPA